MTYRLLGEGTVLRDEGVGLKSREEVSKERERVLHGVEKECISSALVNAIIAAYQIALYRTLGSAANAMSQLLISELGDSLVEYVDHILKVTDHKDVKEGIKRVFKELKVASDIDFKESNHSVWEVKIKDSTFKAAHEMLKTRGIRMFTLSPEALIIAAIARKSLRERGKGNERVKVEAELTDDELVVRVVQIASLKGAR